MTEPCPTIDDAGLEAWFDSAVNREKTNTYDDVKTGPVRRVTTDLGIDRRPITIAGTKGKGSTLRFLEQILLAHGRSTVAFTSPHITLLRERWRLDGRPVELGAAHAATRRVAEAETRCGIALTYFERCFAVACLLAQDRTEADFLVEVGLGGRLDCANVLETSLAICTAISYDHCQVLGHDLASIAGEKLAIARPDAPLVIGPQSAAARPAVADRLPAAGKTIWVESDALPADWQPGLLGDHQRGNAATACRAARELLGGSWRSDAARTGIEGARLSGRCQAVLWQGHELLIDGAHNGESMATTMATARAVLPPDWLVILGTATDKRLDDILAALPPDCEIWRCGYASDRCLDVDGWPPAYRHQPWFPTVTAALTALAPGRPAVITGSLYLAGEALHAIGLKPATTPG